jgi:hypothetical protein
VGLDMGPQHTDVLLVIRVPTTRVVLRERTNHDIAQGVQGPIYYCSTSCALLYPSTPRAIHMDHVNPVGVVVSNFSLSLLKKGLFSNNANEVKLLRGITADIVGGQLVAIMGGSGMYNK